MGSTPEHVQWHPSFSKWELESKVLTPLDANSAHPKKRFRGHELGTYWEGSKDSTATVVPDDYIYMGVSMRPSKVQRHKLPKSILAYIVL